MRSARLKLLPALGLASALAALALAPGAFAKGVRYEGFTSQDQAMNMRTSERGAATRAFLFWRAKCKERAGFRNSTTFRRPLDRTSRAGFHDKRVDFVKDGKLSARYRATIDGKRKTRRKFEGTFDMKVRFFRKGEEYETCTVRDVTWVAKIPQSD